MAQKTAFISELDYRTDHTAPPEFLEITINASEDPSDYVISFYDNGGNLKTGIGADNAVNGEINLGDLSDSWVVHPDNPDFRIYRIESNLATGDLFTTGGGNGARAVTLTKLGSPNEIIDAYVVGKEQIPTPTQGAGAGATFTATGGSSLGQSIHWDDDGVRTTGAYTFDDSVICFEANTLIETSYGRVRAADLQPGMTVLTSAGEEKPVLWVNGTTHVGEEICSLEGIAPIRIGRGSLGPNMPSEDLIVSPQHRILIASKVVRNVTGAYECFVPARGLLTLNGVAQDRSRQRISYVHFLLPDHDIVIANGQPCESFFAGKMARQTLSLKKLKELNWVLARQTRSHRLARLSLTRKAAEKLVLRHVKNRKYLCDFIGSSVGARTAEPRTDIGGAA